MSKKFGPMGEKQEPPDILTMKQVKPTIPLAKKFVDAEVAEQLDLAADAGQWIVMVCRVANGKVTLFRKSQQFPAADLAPKMVDGVAVPGPFEHLMLAEIEKLKAGG